MSKRLVFLTVLVALFAMLSAFAGVVQSQETALPALTEPGPYGVRLTKMTFVDENREDWEIETWVYYPADKSQGTPITRGSLLLRDAPPDRSDAPYPLVVFSHGWMAPGQMMDLNANLASQGYIVAAPQHHDTDPISHEFVDRPLDLMVVLDGLAVITDGDLAGMIDTDNVGLVGYSSGGDAVFQMLGLLSDPLHHRSWCAEHPDLATPECTERFVPLEATIAYRAQIGLQTLSDGTWAPFGDTRIHAVLAIDPGDFPLTNDDTLSAVTTPTMILHGTKDEVNDYEGNAVRTYTLLGTEDRYLISVVNNTHLRILDQMNVPQHFATAFFGKYLQGDNTYDPYLTPEGLPDWPYPQIVWGPYGGD